MSDKKILEVKNLKVFYESSGSFFTNKNIVKAVNGIDININQGEILGMLGPNGVGKSTIFNLITGLIKPDFGSILFNDTNVLDYPISERTTKFKIGYVPQHGGYFHDLTLMENLNAIAEILIKDNQDRISKIDELIAKFELESVVNIKAKFLSGGQKKS